jgi:hypothetical protein
VGPRTCLDTETRGKILSPLPGIEHGDMEEMKCSTLLGKPEESTYLAKLDVDERN